MRIELSAIRHTNRVVNSVKRAAAWQSACLHHDMAWTALTWLLAQKCICPVEIVDRCDEIPAQKPVAYEEELRRSHWYQTLTSSTEQPQGAQYLPNEASDDGGNQHRDSSGDLTLVVKSPAPPSP
jgi:hypothetical protein